MYCSECGAKNKEEDLFCSECGAKLEHDDKVDRDVKPVVKKVRQPMSKKSKAIIIIVVVVLVLLGSSYKVASTLASPKRIAKDYIQALVDKDANKLYKYLNLDGDDTFATKDMFKTLVKEELADNNIENYKITDVDYADGKLSASVEFKYTVAGSSSEHDSEINLVKQKGKKYLFFDNWAISDVKDNMIVKDYTIKVAKGSKLVYNSIKVDKKYLDKDESNNNYDTYVLPIVFTTETELQVVLPSGLEISNRVTPSKYNTNYTVSFDENNITDKMKDSLLSATKDSINTLYQDAIAGKSFESVKSTYDRDGVDLKAIEEAYTSFVDKLADNNDKLKSITFNDISLYDLDVTKEGYFKVAVKVEYDYTIDYKKANDEIETRDKSSSGYMTVGMGYNGKEYYLVDFDEDDLIDYFYGF